MVVKVPKYGLFLGFAKEIPIKSNLRHKVSETVKMEYRQNPYKINDFFENYHSKKSESPKMVKNFYLSK